MVRIPVPNRYESQFVKHRNEEEEAIMSFLNEGGKVAKLADSITAKKLEAKVKKEEQNGARFIFSKDERISQE